MGLIACEFIEGAAFWKREFRSALFGMNPKDITGEKSRSWGENTTELLTYLWIGSPIDSPKFFAPETSTSTFWEWCCSRAASMFGSWVRCPKEKKSIINHHDNLFKHSLNGRPFILPTIFPSAEWGAFKNPQSAKNDLHEMSLLRHPLFSSEIFPFLPFAYLFANRGLIIDIMPSV